MNVIPNSSKTEAFWLANDTTYNPKASNPKAFDELANPASVTILPTGALRERFAEKCTFRHYLLTLMLTESQVMFYSPQNIFGASQQVTLMGASRS